MPITCHDACPPVALSKTPGRDNRGCELRLEDDWPEDTPLILPNQPRLAAFGSIRDDVRGLFVTSKMAGSLILIGDP